MTALSAAAGSLLVLDIGTGDNDNDAPHHWTGLLEPAMEIVNGCPRAMPTGLYPTDTQNDQVEEEKAPWAVECPRSTVSASICKGVFKVIQGHLILIRDKTPHDADHHSTSSRSTETLMQTFFNSDWTLSNLIDDDVVEIEHGDIIIAPMEGDDMMIRSGASSSAITMPATMRAYIFIKGTTINRKRTRDLINASIESFRANLAGFIGCVNVETVEEVPRFVLSETENDGRLRSTRCLAFAMGFHPRLGAQSQIHRHMISTDTAALVLAML
jgi:hypothetical protein